MNKSVVFIIILLVIVLSIIVSQYFHKRHHEYKMADIEKAIRGAYPKGCLLYTSDAADEL